MKKSISLHGPTLFWALLIFTISSIHSLTVPDLGFQVQDKFYHACEFAVFGFLLRRSASAFSFSTSTLWKLSALIGIVYAGLDEIHQYFVPGRYADWGDLVADIVGIFLGIVAFRVWMRYKKA
ncbi:VanZ family protein [candidate division KSB1 bacterium]|nr:VanZ family protein [candidate division KSB1 bacterium]